MKGNRSVPVDTVLPHIAYRDIVKAIRWLAATFGFTEHYRYGIVDGHVSGAQMHLGGAWIMLFSAEGRPVNLDNPECFTQSLTIFVENVDAHYAHTKSVGATIIEELHVTEYGERQYGVVDLDGHRWLFSTHARDVSPEEWGAAIAEC